MAATVITAIVFISGLLFTPLAFLISNRKGVKFAYMLSTLVLAVSCCGFFFAKSFVVCIILSVVIGFGVTGGLIMPKLMNEDSFFYTSFSANKRKQIKLS